MKVKPARNFLFLLSVSAVIFLVVFLAGSFRRILGLTDGVTLLLTGDVMLGRTVMTKSLDLGDPSYPLQKVAGELRKADLVFINLESPLVTGCPRDYSSLKFCADPKMAEGLVSAGVDVAALANNHSLNYGLAGREETRKILMEKGISVTGLGNLATKEAGGTKFGFLGFNFVDQAPTLSDYDLVKKSDPQVDVLVVGVHWGQEYQAVAGKRERQIARELVANGADVVVGHHPHWVQDREIVNGKPVYYSLGNLVFDQMWSERTRRGEVVELVFQGEDLVSQETHKIYMSAWAQPEFEAGE